MLRSENGTVPIRTSILVAVKAKRKGELPEMINNDGNLEITKAVSADAEEILRLYKDLFHN